MRAPASRACAQVVEPVRLPSVRLKLPDPSKGITSLASVAAPSAPVPTNLEWSSLGLSSVPTVGLIFRWIPRVRQTGIVLSQTMPHSLVLINNQEVLPGCRI